MLGRRAMYIVAVDNSAAHVSHMFMWFKESCIVLNSYQAAPRQAHSLCRHSYQLSATCVVGTLQAHGLCRQHIVLHSYQVTCLRRSTASAGSTKAGHLDPLLPKVPRLAAGLACLWAPHEGNLNGLNTKKNHLKVVSGRPWGRPLRVRPLH